MKLLKYEVDEVGNYYILTGEIVGRTLLGPTNKFFIAAKSFKPTKITIGTISGLIEFDAEDIINFASKVLELANRAEGEK